MALRRLAVWLPLAGFMALLAIRAWHVDAMVGAYTGCSHCTVGGLAHHDLAMLALLAALLGLDLAIGWRPARWLLRLAAALLVMVYAADLAVFASLTQRLYLADVLTFGHEGGAMGDFIKALLHRPDIGAWLAVTALVVLTIVAIVWPRRSDRMHGASMLVLATVCLGLWLTPLTPSRYVHPEIVDNVAEVNLGNTADRAFSSAYKTRLATGARPGPRACTRNTDSDRPDVILVAVESLSAYQSRLLGGDVDATPQLDALARANHYFTDFVANGYTTNGGRIALYTGRPPLPPPGLARTLPLRAYRFSHDTLLSYASAAGYQSHYFTTGDLGFLNSEPWLRGLGFDAVEGAENPFYNGMKRWQFKAPEDRALFDRTLDWMDTRKDSRPFLAALLTVTSHPPFVNPQTGRIDQRATFRYVDAQLARFYRKLNQRGFFRHGVLMITGDHRSMTPLHADEYARWGERAFTRVPLVVIGDVDMPRVVTRTFAQTDVPTSFAWLAGARFCLDDGHGNFARPVPDPPRYVMHASGDRRDQVDVYFAGGQHGTVLLDGDDSRWLGTPPAAHDDIIDGINRQRIQEAASARAHPGGTAHGSATH